MMLNRCAGPASNGRLLARLSAPGRRLLAQDLAGHAHDIVEHVAIAVEVE
jgi:hypothetical protein